MAQFQKLTERVQGSINVAWARSRTLRLGPLHHISHLGSDAKDLVCRFDNHT
jgi:hypothetical protein